MKIGNVGIGGTNPVRIQSMTNTNTMNTAATVEQSISMFEAGCELVRITAPGMKEAKNLAVIKRELVKRGYNFPIIADIHFSPKAAEIAASIVEKVRINPGNYTDRNRGKINFTDEEYATSLNNIRKKLSPLIAICKTYGTAMRIGSNHGSLSDRIIDRFGNTPIGMAESAMEFARICRDLGFHDIVFSMKASNTRIMVYATRLLVKKMMDENMYYPVHLGVTEAGDGREGRIKSAVGIGALLSEGIGDTIRVSLTEDPVNEIPVARKIVNYIHQEKTDFASDIFGQYFYPPFAFAPRVAQWSKQHKPKKTPVVVGLPGTYNDQKPDLIYKSQPTNNWQRTKCFEDISPKNSNPVLIESSSSPSTLEFRDFFRKLKHSNIKNPVILHKHYHTQGDDLALEAAVDFGPLFLDGFGDGIFITADAEHNKNLTALSFDILQASGARFTKTEFIACPSCGRTQFDIQGSLKKIRETTRHLTGLKIAVMGCIVNGPGEMADADYGYVGMGAGKVALYKGKKQVRKNLPESQAIEVLIDLIKEYGDWTTP